MEIPKKLLKNFLHLACRPICFIFVLRELRVIKMRKGNVKSLHFLLSMYLFLVARCVCLIVVCADADTEILVHYNETNMPAEIGAGGEMFSDVSAGSP